MFTPRRAVGAIAVLLAASLPAGGATLLSNASAAAPDPGQLTRGTANPILRNDQPYDDLKAGPSSVVRLGAGDYRQWYEAIDAQNIPRDQDFLSQTAYATSSDGTSWTKRGVVFAPLPAPSWEKSEACPTSMIWDGSKWILFYHGGNNTGPRAVGRATSPTGTGNFTRDAANPILQRGASGAWDEKYVADVKVIPPWEGPDSLWRMYYRGLNFRDQGRIGLATSTNGVAFTKYTGNPVLSLGPAGAWDDGNIQAFTPEWDAKTRLFRAWYVARSASAGSAGGNAGYVWSSDGLTWNRSPSNPVLRSVSRDNIEDSIDSYWDGTRYRLVYGQFDLGASPPLRGKGEAFGVEEAPPVPPSGGTTATFVVNANADDGDVERGGAAYPPTAGTPTDGSASGTVISVRRSKATPSYQPVRVGLLRFDTSSLPDDAIVSSAELQLNVTGRSQTDGRSLVAEWYPGSAWPIDGGDWSLADSNSAHAGTALSAIATGQQSFALRGLESVNLTGTTALRLHVSGSATAPTGPNDLSFAAVDHPTLPAPQLVIRYDRGAPPPPTTTLLEVATSGDDGAIERGSASYPPASGAPTDVNSSDQTVLIRRSKASSSYSPVRVGLLRFDTSTIPDDAVVTAAELRVQVTVRNAVDGRSVVAEWYPATAWPVDGGDWTVADANSAHAGTPLSVIAAGQQRAFALGNLASIDLSGPTALRLHVSGSATAPTGPNDFAFAAFDHPTLAAPTLAVTYTR